MVRSCCAWTLAALVVAGRGLLDELVPLFREQTGVEVKVVAVGTGQALELGRRGDADVLLTHAPALEEAFMAEGHGASRRAVMHNNFVVVGPRSDPAGVTGMTSVCDAFRRIAEKRSTFVSRGDDSGTHHKEMEIWKEAGLERDGDWYTRAGAGMAHVLRMAGQMQAYTLTDRGTFLAYRGDLQLEPLVEGDSLLMNPYAVMVVSREKHPRGNEQAAGQFAEFLLAPQTQKAIAAFGVEEFGQPLFFANQDSSSH